MMNNCFEYRTSFDLAGCFACTSRILSTHLHHTLTYLPCSITSQFFRYVLVTVLSPYFRECISFTYIPYWSFLVGCAVYLPRYFYSGKSDLATKSMYVLALSDYVLSIPQLLDTPEHTISSYTYIADVCPSYTT